MPAKEKGGAKEKAAVAEPAAPAPGKIIVEAALDWEKMKVDDQMPHSDLSDVAFFSLPPG